MEMKREARYGQKSQPKNFRFDWLKFSFADFCHFLAIASMVIHHLVKLSHTSIQLTISKQLFA